MLSLLVFNVGAALVLAATAFVGAYLPVILSKRGQATGERSLSFVLGNMLSAGVMVSAGFCHLLGDAIEQLTRTFKYPVAPFLCAVGFMSTLVADQIVEAVTHQEPPEYPILGDGELQILNSVAVGGSGSMADGSSPRARVPHCFSILGAAHSHGHSHGGGAKRVHSRQTSLGRGPETNGGDPLDSLELDSPTQTGHSHLDEEEATRSRGGGSSLLTEQQKAQRSDRNGHYSGSEAGSDVAGDPPPVTPSKKRAQVSFVTACLMAVALCFHSLLEGAALGAQPDVMNSLHIFVAIQAHKGLAAYALGSSIVDSAAETRQFWSVIATFALATPVGIALGYALSSVTTSNGAAAISALASGTFLYVAMMEVIPRELNDSRHRLSKLGMLTLGFGLMSLLAIWA